MHLPLSIVPLAMAGLAGTLLSSRPPSPPTPADSAAAVVDAFHQRMAVGDSAGVLELLAPEAVILESGEVETREQYRSHHLPSDIAFTRAIPATRRVRQALVVGDVAWVSSTHESKGSYKGRALDLLGAELVVLRRNASGWRIAAVHWSSRPRTGGH